MRKYGIIFGQKMTFPSILSLGGRRPLSETWRLQFCLCVVTRLWLWGFWNNKFVHNMFLRIPNQGKKNGVFLSPKTGSEIKIIIIFKALRLIWLESLQYLKGCCIWPSINYVVLVGGPKLLILRWHDLWKPPMYKQAFQCMM